MRLGVVATIASFTILCAGALPARASDPPAGEPVKLTYTWQPGMTTYHRMISTSESTSVEHGKEGTSRDRTAMMSRLEVYSVRDDGTARVATTITRVRREHEDPTTKGMTVYDSANPPAEKDAPEARSLSWLVNKSIIMEITPGDA
jgi:hypothetical protein